MDRRLRRFRSENIEDEGAAAAEEGEEGGEEEEGGGGDEKYLSHFPVCNRRSATASQAARTRVGQWESTSAAPKWVTTLARSRHSHSTRRATSAAICILRDSSPPPPILYLYIY